MVSNSEDTRLQIQTLDTGGAIYANAYLITCRETNESILIDAPGKPDRMLEQVKDKNIKYILMTHSHSDHIGALSKLKSALHAPVAGHTAEATRYPVPLDLELKNGDKIAWCKDEIKVLHTPGHTKGSLCFLFGKHLFDGDTLFPGGPGYTSSPENFAEIVDAITRKLFSLPDDTIVYPGHGSTTLIGKSKEEYKAFSERPHNSGLCGDVLWLKS